MSDGPTIGVATPPASGAPQSVAEALGQITWLLSQSPLHRDLRIRDLETRAMPAILHEQFRIFRLGPTPSFTGLDPAAFAPLGLTREGLEQLPLGVALWGELSATAEAKVERGEKLALSDWKSGDRLWLLELISPFATSDNKLSEIMLMDLVHGPFRSRPFSLHRNDPVTGFRDKLTVAGHVPI